MEIQNAIAALAALAQETRLEVFRLLVEVGLEGMPAGQIAKELDLPLATLSFHLNALRQAGLIEFRRESRSLIYRANFEVMNGLVAYLTENCCGGRQEGCVVPVCEPLAKQRSAKRKKKPSRAA
jgi:ArsR family transcriptional regulator